MNPDFNEHPDKPVVVFMRHAERPEIPVGETGNDLKLSDAGITSAIDFGRSLRSNIRSLNSSPIVRCLATAGCINEASGGLLPVVESTMLGDPGPYVNDKKRAWENWLMLGSEKVLEELMATDKHPPGLNSAQFGTNQLLGYFKQILDGEPGYHVCVSHDIVMVPFISYLLEKPVSTVAWPEFLDAALLYYEKNYLILSYKNLSAKIPVNSLSLTLP